jgi:excisionase family DNA binding protein
LALATSFTREALVIKEKFVEPREIARHLSVSLSWIHKMAIYSDIPVYRVGKNLRFKISEVEEWLSNAR